MNDGNSMQIISGVRDDQRDWIKLYIKSLNEDSLIEMCAALQTNTTVFEVCFVECAITVKVFEAIGHMLKSNTKLQTLKLHHNNFSIHCPCDVFTDGLEKNQALLKLHVDRSSPDSAGDELAKMICDGLAKNTTLRFLRLNDNHISDNGALHFVSLLKTNNALESLYLSKNKITKLGIVGLGEALTANTSLRYLDLHTNTIGDEGALELADMTNTTLHTLNVSKNQLTRFGASALSSSLRNDEMTGSLGVRHLIIQDNDIDDEGLRNLVIALQDNSTLHALSHDHDMNDFIQRWPAAIDILSNHRTLQRMGNFVNDNLNANLLSFNGQYWHSMLHSEFQLDESFDRLTRPFHNAIIMTLLCNSVFGVKLPIQIWTRNIFPFFQRSNSF